MVANTYPAHLIVPKDISDKDIEDCSKFRTRNRFAVLSYYYRKNGASIWRSSQPKAHFPTESAPRKAFSATSARQIRR